MTKPADETLYQIRPFEAFCLLEKAEGGPAESDGPMVVSGPLSSEKEDYDGEVAERAGIIKGLQTFVALGGQVDWNHLFKYTQRGDHIIGRGEPFFVDGRPWLKTTLRKGNTFAEEAYRMVKDRMHVGYSILGDGVKNGKRIVSTAIKMVTIAPQPKGFDQFLQVGAPAGSMYAIAKAICDDTAIAGMEPLWKSVREPSLSPLDYLDPQLLAKALTTGAGIVEPGDTGGRALRSQSLVGGVKNAGWDGDDTDTDERLTKRKRSRAELDLEGDDEQLSKAVAQISRVVQVSPQTARRIAQLALTGRQSHGGS